MRFPIRPALLGLVFSSITLGFALLACESQGLQRRASVDEAPYISSDVDLQHGGDLYERYCTVCHAHDGTADGEASAWLFPPARDFTRGRFRLVSTSNGAPTDDDLVRVLRRGMPGSSMPSWSWLEERDLRDLAGYVRFLAVEGLGESIDREAREDGEPLMPGCAHEIALEWMTPREVLEPVAPVEPSPDTLALGQELYRESCAGCHDTDGRGFDEHPRWNEDGSLNWARDFTHGILKGGGTHADLYRRIRCGLPGSPMGATNLDEHEMAALVTYVRGLIRPGAEERLVQVRKSLRVRRVVGELPRDPQDPRWNQAEPVILALAPLSWRKDAVFTANLSALHDGTDIALRLRWLDPSEDGSALSAAEYSDGAALQLSTEEAPPLFGMGSHARPVNIWHWQAFRQSDVAGATETLERPLHTLRDELTGEVSVMDAPFYFTAPGLVDPSDEGTSVASEGPRSSRRFGEQALGISAHPVWEDGVWEVVFSRSMQPRVEREAALVPGTRVLTACSIWNGSAGDTRGQKSISIWHELRIDP
jgi:mono/diheme cytochrome c family protein